MEITPGMWIADRYQLLREVGPGVFRARDGDAGREVELRILRPPEEIFDTELERLWREVERGLGSDAGEVGDGGLYLVTDTATGRQRAPGPGPGRRPPPRRRPGPGRRPAPPPAGRRGPAPRVGPAPHGGPAPDGAPRRGAPPSRGGPPARGPSGGRPVRRPARRRPAPPPLAQAPQELPTDYFQQPATITLGEQSTEFEPRVTPSGRLERQSAEVARVLDEAEVLLADFAVDVVRKGAEIKFRAGDPQVGYSLLAEDPHGRFAFLEQRVTYQPHTLLGQPSGWINLLLAMNFANHYARGLRCVASGSRLRFRRTLWLDQGPYPFEGVELAAETRHLLQGWAEVFPALSEAQGGRPWHQALQELRDPRPLGAQAELDALAGQLAGELELRAIPGALHVQLHGEDDVELRYADGDLEVAVLLHPWSAPPAEVEAVRQGRPAPKVEALLDELNELNATGGAALVWDPKQGVVARSYLGGCPPLRHRVLDLVALLRTLRERLQLRSLR